MKNKLGQKIVGSIAIAMFLSLTIPSVSNAWYIRVTSGGGAGGFDKTSKTVDNNGNTTIQCAGSGNTPCPTIAYNPHEQPGVDYAMTQISAGVLTGTYSDPFNGTTTTWTSDDTFGDNSQINVNE